MDIIRAIKGTKDILPEESSLWQFIERNIHRFMKSYGYGEIRTPKFENSSLFNRSIGINTDIVSKEMYTWTDQGENNLTLKPEVTASVVRAFIQHNLGKQKQLNKFYYIDSLFRRERPQKGRYRQFEQFGVEAIGSKNPEQDAEIISMAYFFYTKLGLENLKLKINSIGSKESRIEYKQALKDFFIPYKDKLTSTSITRLNDNPLRILDTKVDFEKEIIKNAPKITDFLSLEDKDHFNKVLFYLEKLNIKYDIDHFLVRGLDYYCNTVFEIQSTLLGSQSALCGGGRYDYLIEELGGKSTPAIGFAAGIERLIIALDNKLNLDDSADIYMVTLGNSAIDIGLKIAYDLRMMCNLNVISDMLQKNMKSQLKEANKLKAKHAIIIGENEIANKEVIIKNMLSGNQENISFNQIINYFKK
tara:strand:+ start:985 stop:2235 length:1251 start_codon:yes stop_codon:yes gene_type:complete